MSRPSNNSKDTFEDISSIIVMADVRSKPQSSCINYPANSGYAPGTIGCAVSFPGGKLKLIVNFNATTAESNFLQYEELTENIAIEMANNVLNCQK